jgi:hypothetical protein
MIQAVHLWPTQDKTYPSFDERYRLGIRKRSRLALDPEDIARNGNDVPIKDCLSAVANLDVIASAPGIGIDLRADDWKYRMLTAKDKLVVQGPGTRELKVESTIATYRSKSQKTISENHNCDLVRQCRQRYP